MKDHYLIENKDRYFDVEEDTFVDYDSHSVPMYALGELEQLIANDPGRFRGCYIVDCLNNFEIVKETE